MNSIDSYEVSQGDKIKHINPTYIEGSFELVHILAAKTVAL